MLLIQNIIIRYTQDTHQIYIQLVPQDVIMTLVYSAIKNNDQTWSIN
jgi:hypothetical protein